MWVGYLLLILGCVLHSHTVSAVWTCTEDIDCADTEGSVCSAGSCVCPTGQQLVFSGTKCADAAPYFTSPCVEDFQCSSLFTNFHCRKPVVEVEEQSSEESGEVSEYAGDVSALEGNCFCQPGFHYFLGRCWRSVGFGGTCTRDEDCLGILRDPYNLACVDNTCVCADGYYERQRGECRRIGAAVGDGCIIDDDCRFDNGVCDPNAFQCVLATSPVTFADTVPYNITARSGFRVHGALCGGTTSCPAPFQCSSSLGICVCPSGYYGSPDGSLCLAELGSPATEATCVGFLAEVINGICTCPPNVYFDENMRDCVKATRRLTDACVTDEMCHTFGASSRCGPPQEPWGFRNCECIPEDAVWDESRTMCRLFAGVGESCEVNSDCLAGVLEIECVLNEAGQGICTCPEGLTNVDGLCLTSGLELGEECQATPECTGTPNTICAGGVCSCDVGYQALDGICAPTIGGTCARDSDCTIEYTVCYPDSLTCQCGLNFLEYNDQCWPVLQHTSAACSVSSQCVALLGNSSSCVENACQCDSGYHLRDGRCWPQIGLFKSCSRSSECYLNDISDRVQCRNSLCQCSFDYPYSEELNTCLSASASMASSSFFAVLITLCYVMLN